MPFFIEILTSVNWLFQYRAHTGSSLHEGRALSMKRAQKQA